MTTRTTQGTGRNGVWAVLVSQRPHLFSREDIAEAVEILTAPPQLGRNGKPLMSAKYYERVRNVVASLQGAL